MKPLCLTLIVLLSLGCSKSAWGRAGNVGVGVSAVADLVTTEQALQRGGMEANPLMRDEAMRWVVKGAGVGAVIGSAALIELKGKPIVAHAIRLVVIALNTGLALHNHGVLR